MSQENVEIVRRSWEAWIRGDLDELFEAFDPAVEWDTRTFEGWPDPDVYRGHEGVRRFLEEWLASWERFEAGVENYPTWAPAVREHFLARRLSRTSPAVA
jgi:ketosteroid isomerase-like protein